MTDTENADTTSVQFNDYMDLQSGSELLAMADAYNAIGNVTVNTDSV